MSHNKYEFYDDVLSPIDHFLKDNQRDFENHDFSTIEIPVELFDPPDYLKKQHDLLQEFL